ncbi:DNA recombination-dependent growth factor C [Klebsiella pneumoniae]|nr:DNA recombination-dependent growth factor C [Klebsiella pneumoniae]
MLWFKNLMVYRLSRDIELRAEEMEKQLAELTFTPCGSQDMAKTGWVSPMGSHSDALTHTANGQIIICARKEEKILPSPVIKQALEAKIQKLEADQGRKLKKTEKDSLKDEVLHSLLPRRLQPLQPDNDVDRHRQRPDHGRLRQREESGRYSGPAA